MNKPSLMVNILSYAAAPEDTAWVACRRCAVILALASLFAAKAAHAQALLTQPQDIPVQDRQLYLYNPLGIRLGGFIVYPSVTLGAQYVDNILASPPPTLSDTIFTVNPVVAIDSDWDRNALDFKFGGVRTEYAKYASQDSTQYTVVADGKLDVHRDLTITGQAAQIRSTISRTTDAYAPKTATPLELDETSFNIKVVKYFNRFQITTQAFFQDYQYTNGLTTSDTVQNETFRNHDAYTGFVRLDYPVTPYLSLFGEETVTNNIFDRTVFRNELTTQSIVGTDFSPVHLITGEVGLGYITSDFDDAKAADVGNFIARVKLQYYLTKLVTVSLTGQETVVDSGVPGTPDYVAKFFRLESDYELFRNLLITASIGETLDDYRVIDRHDRYLDMNITEAYRVSRGVVFNLTFNRLEHGSSGAQAGLPFNEDILSLSVTIQH